jgi:hypothetical protein
LESVEPQWANLLHNVTLCGIRPSRLQKTTNAIIEKIPVGWKLKRLRYIGRCQNGISKDGQYFGYGFPFVTYGDVYNNMALPVVASGLVESTEDERIRYSVKRGDVFFTRTSETADEVGFSSVCLKTIPDATFAGFVIRVRPVTEDLLPEFAQFYFRNPFVSQYFAKEMMGDGVTVRFRPHFFPFTEPSVEVDFTCHVCKGKGCNVCKQSGWIEVAGAGMVDPRVFKHVGYDPEQVSGYAFGFGVERIAMIKYGIPDIRWLYENDVRFLSQLG